MMLDSDKKASTSIPLQIIAAIAGVLVFVVPSLFCTVIAYELALVQPPSQVVVADISSRLEADYSAEPPGFAASGNPLENPEGIAEEVQQEEAMQEESSEATPTLQIIEVVSTPTATPTSTPTVVQGEVPTATSTPTSTPKPSSTPQKPTPTPTDTPTPLPTATSTPAPTDTPTPTETPTESPTPTETPKPDNTPNLPTDNVTISHAHYHNDGVLHVRAMSNRAGCIVSLVAPPYTEGTNVLEYQQQFPTDPGAVTVVSSCGGSDTRQVQ